MRRASAPEREHRTARRAAASATSRILAGASATSRVLAAALAASACAATDDRAGPRVTVTDSAGLVIITSHRPGWEEGGAWTLDFIPSLEIGVAEGAEEYQLFRAWGGSRMADARIAVLNAGTHEVRFFGPDGRFVGSTGREGAGPGEFRSPRDLFPYRGDSLVVLDVPLDRFSILAPDGSFARVAPLASAALNPNIIGVFDDGSLLLEDRLYMAVDQGPRDQPVHLVRLGPDGALLDSLGELLNYRSYPVKDEAGRNLLVGAAHFGARTTLAGGGEAYYVGMGDAYEVLRHGPDGTLQRRIRWEGPDRAITGADRDAYRAQMLDSEDEQRLRVNRALLEQVPFADAFAAYRLLRVDRTGHLWALDTERPGREAEGSSWTIFDPDGRWLGTLQLPPKLQLLEAGEDWVLGVARDELGVERVRLYDLDRGRAPGE